MSRHRIAPMQESEQRPTKSRWCSVYMSFVKNQANPSWTLGIVYIMGYVVQQEAGNSSLSVLFLSAIISLLSGLCRYQLSYSCIKTRLREVNGNASEFAYAWLEFFGQLSLVTLCGRFLSSTLDAIWGEPWHQYVQTNFQPLSMTNLCPDFPTGVVIFLLGIMTSLGLETNRHFRHAYFISTIAITILLTLLFCKKDSVQETSFDVSDLNLLEASAICCLPLSGALSLKHPDEVRARFAKKDKRPQVLGFTILAQFLSLGLTTVAFTMYSSTKNPTWSVPMNNLNTHPIVHLLLNLFCVVASSLVIVDTFSQTWPLLQNLAVNGFVWPVFHREDSLTQTPITCVMSVTLISVCMAIITPTKALFCSALLPLLLGNLLATVYVLRQSYCPFIATLQEKSHRILSNSSYQRMDPRPLSDEPDVDHIVLEYLGLSVAGKPNQRPFNATLVRRLIAALLASQFALAVVVRLITLRPYIFAAAAAAFLLLWIVCVLWLYRQPCVKQDKSGNFQMPFPPFLTVIASLFNCLLLAHLPPSTWMATTIWAIMGVLLYVRYGKTHTRTKARSSINRPVLQLGTCFYPATVRHIHIQPSSPAENLGSDCLGMVSETFNETTANSVTPWAEQTVYGSFRMWQILLLGGGICLSLVVLLCCCVRIRIPRTKQEIEADFRRKQLAKRFREELKRIRNSELDIMDLKNALDRLRVDFKSDSESLNPSDSMFQNAVSGDGRSGPISNSNMGTQQWLELTISNLRSTENC